MFGTREKMSAQALAYQCHKQPAPIAQLAEQWPLKPLASGSNPDGGISHPQKKSNMLWTHTNH